jgi:hypothetical protein
MTRALIIATVVLSASYASAAKWQKADAPFSRTPLVSSSSTDSKLGLYTKGRLLKVGPQAPSGRSSLSADMFGDVEISVAKKAGVSIPEEKKGAVIMTYPGNTVGQVANQLQQKGIGKIVRKLKDGSYILDTSK